MNKVTGLKEGKNREKRINVYVDGKFAVNLLAEVVIKEGLKVGQELTTDQLESLAVVDRYQRCRNSAIRYLGYRQRSEDEVRQRLQRHGYDTECIEKTISGLKDKGLVDDTAFARFWKENHESFSPRSRRLTALELRRKGLDSDIIEKVTGEMDDSESAYRAALGKARRLSLTDNVGFRRRLAGYLVRRGFGYDVVQETVNKIYRESGRPLECLTGPRFGKAGLSLRATSKSHREF